jgi:hypothetical protein
MLMLSVQMNVVVVVVLEMGKMALHPDVNSRGKGREERPTKIIFIWMSAPGEIFLCLGFLLRRLCFCSWFVCTERFHCRFQRANGSSSSSRPAVHVHAVDSESIMVVRTWKAPTNPVPICWYFEASTRDRSKRLSANGRNPPGNRL